VASPSVFVRVNERASGTAALSSARDRNDAHLLNFGLPAGYRVTDANGSPISGAKIKFYNAGGLVARTVYSDSGLSASLGSTVFCGSDGFPVASSGSSTPVNVYTGTTAYKVVIATSADVTILTSTTIGMLTPTFLTSGSTPPFYPGHVQDRQLHAGCG
jgi:hypothetical protein